MSDVLAQCAVPTAKRCTVLRGRERLCIRRAIDPPVVNVALFPASDEISFGPRNELRHWKRANPGLGTEGRRAYGGWSYLYGVE